MNAREHEELFTRWLREHAAMLHHVVNGFASGADRHDLMQELLLALWRALPAFRGDARPSTFIYRVVHNCAITWQRAERSRRQRLDRYEVLTLPAPSAPGADCGGDQQLLEALYARLRALQPADRSLLLLHLDGQSYRDIAAILGMSEGNVGVRLHRLKQTISAALHGETHGFR